MEEDVEVSGDRIADSFPVMVGLSFPLTSHSSFKQVFRTTLL